METAITSAHGEGNAHPVIVELQLTIRHPREAMLIPGTAVDGTPRRQLLSMQSASTMRLCNSAAGFGGWGPIVLADLTVLRVMH